MSSINYYLLLVVVSLLNACSTIQPLPAVQQTSPAVHDSPLETELDQLCRNISSSLAEHKGSKIAVTEFTQLDGSASDLGKFLAKELTTRLSRSRSFQVVTRRDINNILKEQQLDLTGIVDEKTASDVGLLLGVDYIATGVTADLGSDIKVNARIISVAEGSVFSSTSVMIPKNYQTMMHPKKNIKPVTETPVSPKKYDITGTGAEVTLTRGNPQHPQNEPAASKESEESKKLNESKETEMPTAGMHMPWRDVRLFDKEMHDYWAAGYYPASVEGRNNEGRSQFRAVLLPFPKRVWWFYWLYDQTQSAYEEHKRKMIAEGFEEIHLQIFTDRDGIQKYQTCWIKYGS